MKINNIFNKIEGGINKAKGSMSSYFNRASPETPKSSSFDKSNMFLSPARTSNPVPNKPPMSTYFDDSNMLLSPARVTSPSVRQTTQNRVQEYDIPPVISNQDRALFIEQAELAGVSPNEFGRIARREQGANTLPHQAAMVGGADPTDKGVMQVNEMHNALIQQRFIEEIGREYNPNNSTDSIIAARMILQENRRQLDQMRINGSHDKDYKNSDLIDTYNTGARGWIDAMNGDVEAMARLQRYQNAGQK